MELQYSKKDKTIVVYFQTPLDISNSPVIEKSLEALIDQFPEYNFVLNMSNVDYINSAGLGALIITSRRIEANRRTLGMSNLTNQVKKVIDILDAGDIIEIYDDEEDAIRSAG